jgi:hypothetical protein
MPEGSPSAPEFSPRVIGCASNRDCTDSAGVPSDTLNRIEREIRGLEQEIAFLDVICRSYEQCFASSDD